MSEEKPLTGVKKREQIAGTRKQVFIWVALASAVVVVCLVVGLNIVQRINYQGKVNGELSKADQALKSSVNSIDGLIDNVDALRANEQLNLKNLKSDDSTVFQVVIDALPTEDDSVALSSSIQARILAGTGVTIDQLSIESTGSTTSASSSSDDESTSSSSSAMPTAQPITFRLSVVGNYDSVTKFLQSIENTIRPIKIDTLEIEGSDDRLTATITATTYYSPNVDYTVGSKEVPYEEN